MVYCSWVQMASQPANVAAAGLAKCESHHLQPGRKHTQRTKVSAQHSCSAGTGELLSKDAGSCYHVPLPWLRQPMTPRAVTFSLGTSNEQPRPSCSRHISTAQTTCAGEQQQHDALTRASCNQASGFCSASDIHHPVLATELAPQQQTATVDTAQAKRVLVSFFDKNTQQMLCSY
jgi:hypothetical protein